MKGYPRLSETFIAQELHGLEKRGVAFGIWSLRRPTDGAVHPVHRAITAPVTYLPEYLRDDPARVAAARKTAATLPGYEAAKAAYAADLARDRSASRRRRFGQAAVLAAELPPETAGIYVHYLHTPASVARYAALMRGLPFAFSAHAKDIYTSPDWDLRTKIADAAWGATCTAYNAAVLRDLADDPAKIDLVYHGLDTTGFTPPKTRKGPLTVLSVCRAVEKKGLDDVLRALAKLPGTLDWRFVHVGGGALIARLKALATKLSIADRVDFRGALPKEEVAKAYAEADIFVLASRIAKNGDRDGLPNVIMEAMAMALPVVSTKVSAVPEIVTEATGCLVPPRDPKTLGEALATLAADKPLRARLGAAGRARVMRDFSPDPGLDRLTERLATLSAPG